MIHNHPNGNTLHSPGGTPSAAAAVSRGMGSALAEAETLLDLAPIAEPEIDAARHRTGSDLSDSTLLLLRPTDLMKQVASSEFRAHCRKLPDRITKTRTPAQQPTRSRC